MPSTPEMPEKLRIVNECFEKQGPDGAIRAITDMLAADGNDCSLIMRLAECYLQKGDCESAETQLRKAESLEPDSWRIYDTYAELYIIKNRFKEASEYLSRSMSLVREDDHRAIVLGSYARFYYRQHEYSKAMENIKEALRLLPGNPSIVDTFLKIEERTWWLDEKLDGVSDGTTDRSVSAGAPAMSGDTVHDIIAAYEKKLGVTCGDAFRSRIDRILSAYRRDKKSGNAGSPVPFSVDRVGAYRAFFDNLVLNEIETAQHKLVLTSKPRSLTVSVTNYCNLECVMCESRATGTHWTIPDRTMKEVVGYFPYLEYIMWQGGEVFMHNGFADILKKAKQYPHIRQAITTNGMLLTKELAEEIVAQPDMTLTISIDAVDKELYESIRRGAKFDTLLRNIGLLNELRAKNGSGLKLNINVVVMKSNYRYLSDIIDFAGRNKFEFVLLTSVKGNKHNEENIFERQDREALEYLSKTIVAVEEKARGYGIRLHNWLNVSAHSKDENTTAAKKGETQPAESKRPMPVAGGMLCNAPWQRLYINCLGDVYPECVCRIPRPFGNSEDYTLSELWNSKGMQVYRKRMIDRTYHDLCNRDCYSGVIPSDYLQYNR